MTEVSEIHPKVDRVEVVPTRVKILIMGARGLQDFFIGCAELFGVKINKPVRNRIIDTAEDL